MSVRSPALRVLPGGKVGGAAPLSEAALVAAIARGDRSVAGELCQRVLRVVDATLYRVLGSRDADHDDLVQASFEQIVSGLYAGKFSGKSSLATWAAAVTCNVALHAIRRRRTERRLFDFSGAADQAAQAVAGPVNAERQVGARRELQEVRLRLSEMSEKLAETLLLHDMLGHELNETAALLGVSVAAAQSRLVRGRKELARRLGRATTESVGEVK